MVSPASHSSSRAGAVPQWKRKGGSQEERPSQVLGKGPGALPGLASPSLPTTPCASRQPAPLNPDTQGDIK